MKHLAWCAAALTGFLVAGQAMAAGKPTVLTRSPLPATLAVPAASLTVTAARTLAQCSPYNNVLAQGEALNTAGKFDDALALADGILKKSPDDFQTNFFKGKTLFLKAALTDPNRWNPPLPLSAPMAEGFDLLSKTANELLPQVDQACVALTNPYSILNTIGAFYLNRGYFKEAQSYLLRAYATFDKVPTDGKRKICDNLGLVYLVQLQPDLAMHYYGEGIKYGSKVAPAQIKKAQGLKTSFFAQPIAGK